MIFGDGAGAAVLGPESDPRRGIFSVHLHSEGRYAEKLMVEAPSSKVRPRVTEEMLDLAAAVRPKLLADGMFLVGLDIVGDKLMEVNVFSPGGLGTAEALYGVNFADPVIDALEHKVRTREDFTAQGISNARLATL